MRRTRVGWANGAEVVQVDFDPQQLSYEKLLDVFWSLHNPCSSNNSRLYARLIMYHDNDQRTAAEASFKKQQEQRRQKVTTLLEPVTFQLAKTSDQKYYLRNSRALFAELSRHYPTDSGLLNSTAAARVNGYLGGNGSKGQLQRELPRLGISEQAAQRLLR